jgi:hypothetical protein
MENADYLSRIFADRKLISLYELMKKFDSTHFAEFAKEIRENRRDS